MQDIVFLDREKKKMVSEKVYGHTFLKTLYENRFARKFLLPWFARHPLSSYLYGLVQKSAFSKGKIAPFIEKFDVDPSEFLDPIDSFGSFNDFFIRKLKPEARPIATGNDVAILPADGRYLVYPNLHKVDGFLVKGKRFCLAQFLQSKSLAQKYQQGSMVIARLCPTDYHRFHFPCNCLPSPTFPIDGFLYSVNPIALRRKIEIFTENKRVMTTLRTNHFGEVLFIEVGATFVGSIHQTFTPFEPYAKGDEKGYFSFGGSSLVLLFEPDTIQFDQDLIDASSEKVEVRALMGQSMGRAIGL